MIRKYKHISFDLDGTLVHTIPEYRHKVVPDVVKKLGGHIKEKHSVDKFWFEAGRDTIIKDEFALEPNIFWNLFRQVDSPENRSVHTRAYIDSKPAFRRLKKLGKIISIITGAPAWIAEMEIRKLNGAPYDFYLPIGESEFKQKPDPEGFFYALKKLSVEPKDTVYIGNSNEDAHFAKNAGVDFVYLERKEHQFDLKDFAIGIIHSLDELS